MPRLQTSFLLDVDGTLVDSVYHQVLAWHEAFQEEGIELAVWRIHRRIGMSGGLFANMFLRETGLALDPDRLERLRRLHTEAYNRLRPGPPATGVKGAPGLSERGVDPLGGRHQRPDRDGGAGPRHSRRRPW